MFENLKICQAGGELAKLTAWDLQHFQLILNGLQYLFNWFWMGFPLHFQWNLNGLQYFFIWFGMGLHCTFNGIWMDCNTFPIYFGWVSIAFSMEFEWISLSFQLTLDRFRCVSISCSMDVQRNLKGFPIDFPWMFNGCWNAFQFIFHGCSKDVGRVSN